MIRLSGTAADAAGAGQLQGSSGFGRRSLFLSLIHISEPTRP